jgi:Acyl-CoA thioester hydrolase/BAAT N-terminal region
MGFVLGFLPWILYWVLIGNAPFRVAVCVVLGVAVATQIVGRLRHEPWRSLDVGSLAAFTLLTVAAFVFDDAFLQSWMQPLSNLGITLVALGGLLVGRPFVRDYAVASVDAATARTDGFATITRAMTWLWVGIFAGMTVLSAVPPVVDGDATLRDSDDLLSILCYWVLPYVLLGFGGLVSGLFPPWFDKRTATISKREAAEAPVVAPQPQEPPDAAAGGLVLDAPALSRYDEPFPVVLRGGRPGSRIELTTSGHDLYSRPWRSTATFTVPASGLLDVGALDPDSGDWSRAAPAAPLTAMRFRRAHHT